MKEIFITSLLVIFSIANINCAPKDDPKAEACKAMANNHFKAAHKYFMDCHVELKSTTTSMEETYEKMGCSVKCILKKDNLLDDGFMTSEELLKKAISDRVTPDYSDKLMAKYSNCVTKFGSKLDPSEELCKSYKEYGLCIQEATSHVCYE